MKLLSVREAARELGISLSLRHRSHAPLPGQSSILRHHAGGCEVRRELLSRWHRLSLPSPQDQQGAVLRSRKALSKECSTA